MKNIISLLLFFLLLSCENKVIKKPIILYQFTDSTYTTISDSISTTNLYDIIDDKAKPLTGYFKIYDKENSVYSFGEIYKSKNIGKWLSFEKNLRGKYILRTKANFNGKGKLLGSFIMYDDEGKARYIDNYNNGIPLGRHQTFYDSGKLFHQYEIDAESNYINDYIFYSEIGDTLYYENFSNQGTGYLKKFDEYNFILEEGKFINKKKEGWHKEYIGLEDNRPEIRKEFYKNDSLVYSSITYYEGYIDPEINKLTDSIVYNYLKNKNKTESIYYYKGKVIKKHIE